jgi:hypothetical protein
MLKSRVRVHLETIMPDQPTSKQLIIRGVTSAGQTFRPSDWAERLAGVLSVFGVDSRINYSPYLHPMSCEKLKCLVIDAKLEQVDSRAWSFIMGFARDNDLATEPFSR